MPYVLIHGDTYTYSVQRRPRRTLQLQITAPRVLCIKAPKQIPSEELLAFVRDHADWIQSKSILLQNSASAKPPPPLENGSVLPFRGRNVTLAIKTALAGSKVQAAGQQLRVNLCPSASADLPCILKKWYIRQASLILAEKTAFWCEKIDVQVNRIVIKEQKTRWGSCSSLGNINYNWRIVMAPEKTIDYLVIHELSHRRHLNHSPDFWALVARHCPDYPSHRLWLKQHGNTLFKIL